VIEIDIQKELHGANGDILLDINLQIANHSFVALSGDSGSGKTTLLRAIAGLESGRGRIIVDGKIWQDDKTTLRVQDRGIGFVFQDYALFDNMSVVQNLLYANKDKTLANKLLDMTNLTALKNRLPHTLSGGQKQRVSLCRAMMNRPKLLLLDEPLSALDVSMRVRLQNEILSLHKEFGTTTIMVSHDPSEIYKLSNRVVILNSGKIIDDGDAKDVLLKSKGSAKFSFEGEILDIISIDIINVAIIAIGQQIVEVVISNNEANNLKVGQIVNVGTKAFSPTITI
jgi:molybdate transport system ATP-binding protein